MAQTTAFPRNWFVVRRLLLWGGGVFALFSLVAVVFQAVGLYQIGINVTPGLVLGYVAPDSAADIAGLEVGDLLWKLDGQPVYSRNHFRFLRRPYQAGDTMRITAIRSGLAQDYDLVLQRSDDAIQNALVLFLVGLSFLVIGGLVSFLRLAEKEAQLFYLCCCALAFSYGVVYARSPWLGLLENMAFFVPSFIVHFFLVFPVRRPWISKRWVQLLIYAPGAILFAVVSLTALAILRVDVLYVLTASPRYEAFGAFIGLALLLYTYGTITDRAIRQQIKWIIWGVGSAVTLNLFVILFRHIGPLSHLSSVLLANWSVMVVPVSFLFSIVRYRLFDIDTVINKSFVYALLSLIVILLYLLSTRFSQVFGLQVDFTRPIPVAILIILLSVLLDPLRHLIQTLVDRIMYWRRPNYQQIMQDFSQDMVASLELNRLLDVLLRYLAEITSSERVQVFLLDLRRGEYTCSAASGTRHGEDSFSPSHALVRAFDTEGEILCIPEDVSGVGDSAVEVGIEAFMRQHGLVLCIPFRSRRMLLGWFAVGAQRSGALYTLDERRFLSALADQAAVSIQNALLYDDSQRRAHQLSILNQIGGILASTLDLHNLLNLLLARLVDVFAVESASLLLLDSQTGELVFEVAQGRGGAPVVGLRVPAQAHSIASMVMHTGKPFLSNNIQAESQWYPRIDEQTGFTTQQLICVPIVQQDEQIGVIEVVNRTDGAPFTTEDMELLIGLAGQASTAIQSAQLYASTDQALAERVEELSTMQEIDRQLNATLDFERVMDLTLKWATSATHADAGSLGLVVDDADRQGIWIVAAHGYPLPVGQYQENLWPLGQGVVGQVVSSAEIVCLPDVREPLPHLGGYPAVRSELVAPIVREQRVIGILDLLSNRLNGFGDQDKAFVSRLAGHAAIAIENARLYAQVKRANDSKTEFVSLVSHELKAPMTIIKGYAELIEITMAEMLRPDQKKLLRIIMSNVEQMQTLINDLLQLARLESGQLALECYPVRVQAVLGEVLTSLRHSIDEKELEISLDAPGEVPMVCADPVRLNQILVNLIGNAIKYTPEGGSIRLSIQVQPEHRLRDGEVETQHFVCYAIQDTGIGISPEDQARLFQRFFRANHIYVRDQSGTGLGLSITKTLVEMQGGRIWAKSELGKGSTFYFTVPVAD
jgi:signal transduction histidine kinase